MNCDIVRDLIPLCVDGCCSEETKNSVKEHIDNCDDCRMIFEDMKSSADIVMVADSPQTFSKLNDWKASVLQSVLLFISFALITAGVAMEARTPFGASNGVWAVNLVIPATGFMLSLANWYFVRIYKSRKCFSNCSLAATLAVTLCAYIWSAFHYEMTFFKIFASSTAGLQEMLLMYGIGAILTVLFCVLSKILSDRYAKMLGKE